VPYLDRQACLRHVDETTFRLQPADYRQKYPKWAGLVGLEIEMQPVDVRRPLPDGRPGRVQLQGETGSVAALLRKLAHANGWPLSLTQDDHGHPLLLSVQLDHDDQITFEPGGQIEFSSKPYPCLSEAVRRMRSVQSLLEEMLRPHGIELVQIGINPWHSIPEIGLQMAKGRYRAMDRYFSAIGEFGQRMMRQTCTVQVNLDFGPDPDTLARRYLASQLLAPIAAATFSYSPHVDGKEAGMVGFRTRVWRDVDRRRTGLPGLARLARDMTRDAAVETYLEFALAAPVVFVTGLDYKVPEPKVSFGEWLVRPIDGLRPTLDDFKTHLTLLFPEVRPRGFLELRSIDCQPRAFQAVPASYMTGLLYDQRALGQLLDELLPRASRLAELLPEAAHGLAHPELASLAARMMDLSIEAFSRFTTCYTADGCQAQLVAFRDRFTARGRTPGDELAGEIRRGGGLTVPLLQRLEETWAKVAANTP
jgi:glutamate--cysteine ligase